MTQEQALALFEYRDGKLFWRVQPSRGVSAGDEAGTIKSDGHRRVLFKRKGYYVHRVIWLMHYGEVPKEIDHIDLNPLNNKLENLRPANGKNQQNVRIRSHNTSGEKNVFWHKASQKWFVMLSASKVKHCIGYFKDFEFASLVATEAREKYHGAFANHGH